MKSPASDQIMLDPLHREAIFLDELENIGAFLSGQAEFVGSVTVEVEDGEDVVVLALVQRLSDLALFSVVN